MSKKTKWRIIYLLAEPLILGFCVYGSVIGTLFFATKRQNAVSAGLLDMVIISVMVGLVINVIISSIFSILIAEKLDIKKGILPRLAFILSGFSIQIISFVVFSLINS